MCRALKLVKLVGVHACATQEFLARQRQPIDLMKPTVIRPWHEPVVDLRFERVWVLGPPGSDPHQGARPRPPHYDAEYMSVSRSASFTRSLTRAQPGQHRWLTTLQPAMLSFSLTSRVTGSLRRLTPSLTR